MRPFLWGTLLSLALLFIWTLVDSPRVREMPRLVIFTVLMIIHAVLHWNLAVIVQTRARALLYFTVQSALATLLVLVGNSMGMVIGLYMALIGELMGVLSFTPIGFTILVFLLGLSALMFGVINGMENMWMWTLPMFGLVPAILIFILMFRRQLSERERVEGLLHELEAAHHRLEAYAEQVEDLTLVAERQRMARELHDTLSQGLAGIILQLEAASSYIEGGRVEKAGSIITHAMQRARETLADARRAIGDLRELPAASIDLPAAAHELCDRFEESTSIPCNLEISSLPRLPERVHEPALHAIGEGLLNIARHAQATQVQVSLLLQDKDLVVRIQDNGSGLDPSSAVGAAGHYGLLGLRERARLADGSFTVESQPGSGTCLTMTLPIASTVSKISPGKP